MANLSRLRTIHRETLLSFPLTSCKSSIVILMIRMTLIHGKVGGLTCSLAWPYSDKIFRHLRRSHVFDIPTIPRNQSRTPSHSRRCRKTSRYPRPNPQRLRDLGNLDDPREPRARIRAAPKSSPQHAHQQPRRQERALPKGNPTPPLPRNWRHQNQRRHRGPHDDPLRCRSTIHHRRRTQPIRPPTNPIIHHNRITHRAKPLIRARPTVSRRLNPKTN